MSLPTHFVATTLLVKVLGWHAQNAWLAYFLGVGIDLDELIKIKQWLKRAKNKRFGIEIKSPFYRRTFIQEPISLLWVSPFSIFLGSWAPLLSFLTHLTLDYLEPYEKRPFGPFSKLSLGSLAGNRVPRRMCEGLIFMLAVFGLWVMSL